MIKICLAPIAKTTERTTTEKYVFARWYPFREGTVRDLEKKEMFKTNDLMSKQKSDQRLRDWSPKCRPSTILKKTTAIFNSSHLVNYWVRSRANFDGVGH